MRIPKNHPRYQSLKIRETLVKHFKNNIVVPEGLIAHGRGEMFDYLIGERTTRIADYAEKTAAAYLVTAQKAVISVNGNTAALVGRDIVKLAKILRIPVEVNLFHRSAERIEQISAILKNYGADKILAKGEIRLPNLTHSRAICSKNGIYSADVVFVPLEDGDRTVALRKMGKKVIAVDLNPLSRTAQAATVTIVDNIVRAVPQVIKYVKFFRRKKHLAERQIAEFDNRSNLNAMLSCMKKRLEKIAYRSK